MKRVNVSICKITKRKSPYRIRWKSRKSDKYQTQWFSNRAKADEFRKEIEHYENGFPDVSENTDLQETRESQLLLKQTDNECANGKSIEFAVNWFIKNYQGDEDIHSIEHYYREYEKVRVSAKAFKESDKLRLTIGWI